ncbi:MAG TPA: ABC transporter substrate-binding protein [Phenylobacterium sp.]|nr:ABC transporter substrate-binding protein [Phenylobacterium sp.]
MIRRSLTILAALAALAACSPPEVAKKPPITVVGWGGTSQAAHRGAYWTEYARQTGTLVKEDVWSGGIGVLRAKAQGGEANWDVVQAEVEEVILGCEEGVLEKLDWAKIGGKEQFLPFTVHDCGVGAMVWSELFAYDGARLKDGPKTWADFFDVKRFPGKRGMRKTPKYVLEAALMADGVPPADVYKVLATPAGVDRAFRKLETIKPQIVWWSSVSQVPDLLASGEVAVSMATPGRLILANRNEGKDFRVVWDGNIYAVDFWVVPKNAPNKAGAMDLIRFMTRPENQKKLPALIPTGPSNKQTIAEVDPALLADTPLAPENIRNALPLDAEFWVENTDQLSQRFNAWAAR